jgi:NTE family protein
MLVGSAGKNRFLVNYQLGYSFDDAAPVERWYRIGGLGRLSGLVPDQLSGRHSALLSMAYYRRLNEVQLLPAYAGFTLEAGNVWNRRTDIGFDDLRYGGSLFIGAETPIGPVYLAWGISDNGDNTAYFYVGNPFRFDRFY